MNQQWQDSYLLMELTKLRSSDKVDEAFSWFSYQFLAKDYLEFREQCPRGSPERRKFSTVCNFFELCGALVYRGDLSEDLFFEMGFGLDRAWQKMKGLIVGFRADTDPRMYENFEWLYRRSLEWGKTNPPKF
ncbi:MAG: DUF4760 domain-containing protein [Coprothermobacterota bacterium]|nr:DUF4760 domain-containing protein [Coprothermobacterota bacterium]